MAAEEQACTIRLPWTGHYPDRVPAAGREGLGEGGELSVVSEPLGCNGRLELG